MNDDKINLLDYEKIKQFINDKEKNSVFTVASIRTILFKNLFKLLKDVFINVTLKINSEGISIYKFEWSKTSKVKKNEMSSLFYFTNIISGNHPLILSDKMEKYNCNVDTIFIKFLTSDLEKINKHITDDGVLYFFINKENYNSETNKASSIQFYLWADVSISDIIIDSIE